MAEKSWLAANRDTAVRFVRASMESFALMKKDRAAFNAALAKWFNIRDPVTQNRMYRGDRGDSAQSRIRRSTASRRRSSSTTCPQMRKFKAEDFYDASVMTELDRSGFLDRVYR